jgi:VCBS repeat-containing protein
MGFPIPGTGSVTEDTAVVGGKLQASGDVNILGISDTGLWTPAVISGAYGSQLVINGNGVWSYTATNSDPAIQALNTGETLQEVFTVTSTRGTTTITITINGLDEPPCFVRGTRISTPQGARPVEDLQVGDEVLTADEGPRKIVWIGSKRVSAGQVPDFEKLQPIRILPDTFGPGIPSRELRVSPMHRISVRGAHAMLLFGEQEVLCAAKMLVNGTTILRGQADEVEYFHILFDEHQVILADGCETESLYPGRVGLSNFDRAAQEEVFGLFPDLRSLPESYGPAARRILKRHEGLVLGQAFTPAGLSDAA